MDKLVAVICVFLACLVGSGLALQCYECNVWKAGYGHLCDNPRIRDDCTVCMKTETTLFMGYYKNTPRSSTTISRICGKSRTTHFSHECHRYTTADGTSVRCYCDDDLCNSAPNIKNSLTIAVVIAPLLVLLRNIYH